VISIGKRGAAQRDIAGEESRFLFVPTAYVEQRERDRLKRARYEAKHPGRSHHKKRERVNKAEREFIVWDGEGPQDTGYSLLGNSEGGELCYPHLKTRDCLEFLLSEAETYPDGIHVGFAFNYDVSCILGDLPERCFRALREYTRTTWEDYEIEHIPGKWFGVKQGRRRIRIFDVFSYFNKSLIATLEEWKIGPWKDSITTGRTQDSPKFVSVPDASDSSALIPRTVLVNIQQSSVPSYESVLAMSEREIVEVFKSARGSFAWADIKAQTIYMRLELKYMKMLMERLRETFSAAGYLPDSWHGPGALARMALKRHNVYQAMSLSPPDVQIAARYAYYGGRFSPHLCGHPGTAIYSADINSAYPYAATFLPNLARGRWRRVHQFEPGKFGVYHIEYESHPEPFRIYPLPYREKNGGVVWPYRVTGWYWAPEAKLVAEDSDARFLEGWVFDEEDETDRPFGWLTEYYRRRKMLKRQGNPAEYTFKLIINSVYGQLAQRKGYDRKKNTAPDSHQLEWAGFITSMCRAMVYRLALAVGEDNVISIDTDGVYATKPFPLPASVIGSELGQWEVDEYEDGIFWQSGMYTLKDDGVWVKAKSRGIPRGSMDPSALVEALREGSFVLRTVKSKFVGYALANGDRAKLNTWIREPAEYVLGGNGKVQHNRKMCPKICDGEVHKLMNVNMRYGPFTDPNSHPHFLPWLENAKEMRITKKIGDSMTLFDMLDEESEYQDYV